MGNSTFGKIIGQCYRKKEVRILFQGLDAAGKTTILYRLKLGEVVTTIPTIGFNVETIEYKNIVLTTWDVGSRNKSRPLMRHYYPNTQAVVFVVDSNDRERIDETRDLMADVINVDELRNCVFVVVANKQDLSTAMTLPEVRETLKLDKLFGENRIYELFGASAIKGEGLYELLDWLSSTLINGKPPTEQNNSEEIVSDPAKDDDKLNFLFKPLYKLKEFVWT